LIISLIRCKQVFGCVLNFSSIESMAIRSGNTDEKWYLKPIFTSFWNHYNQCNELLEQNGHKMVEFSDEIDDIKCLDCDKTDPKIENNRKEMSLKSATNSDSDRSHQKMDTLESIDENELKSGHNISQQQMDFDYNQVFDVNEEYLEFIMKTKRHQNERKILREKRIRYNDRVEYVDISRFDSFCHKSIAPKRNDKTIGFNSNQITSQEPSAHELKQQKMYELYGDDYNIIQGMEAALQLNYDRLCDLNQPKFWPIMPIRMHRKQE
jgi:gem associated protein 8